MVEPSDRLPYKAKGETMAPPDLSKSTYIPTSSSLAYDPRVDSAQSVTYAKYRIELALAV